MTKRLNVTLVVEEDLLREARAIVKNAPCSPNKPAEVRRYIGECMDDMEKVVIETTTKKAKLTAVQNWDAITEPEDCAKCEGKGQHVIGQ